MLRKRLTYANVVSTACLFIVLGGTSYAVATNSIGSGQIKNNSIRSKDIRNGQVTSRDVKNRALRAADFKAGQLPAGPPGAQGPQGPKGQPGSARAYGELQVTSPTADFELVPGRSKNVIAVTQAPDDYPAACIQVAPTIDAATAVIVATPNTRQGEFVELNTVVSATPPLGVCAGDPAHTIEVVTTKTSGGGAKRSFFFAVM